MTPLPAPSDICWQRHVDNLSPITVTIFIYFIVLSLLEKFYILCFYQILYLHTTNFIYEIRSLLSHFYVFIRKGFVFKLFFSSFLLQNCCIYADICPLCFYQCNYLYSIFDNIRITNCCVNTEHDALSITAGPYPASTLSCSVGSGFRNAS